MVVNTHKKIHCKMLRSFENIEENGQMCPTYGVLTLDLESFHQQSNRTISRTLRPIDASVKFHLA